MILVIIEQIIPKDITINGKNMLWNCTLNLIYPCTSVPIRLTELISKLAQIASASDANKSAFIPTISPTLSPTLSAITAGFLGLSSDRFCYILPTKSAPTSAALVKIPPPTRANKATVDAPNAYPAIDWNKDWIYYGLLCLSLNDLNTMINKTSIII